MIEQPKTRRRKTDPTVICENYVKSLRAGGKRRADIWREIHPDMSEVDDAVLESLARGYEKTPQVRQEMERQRQHEENGHATAMPVPVLRETQQTNELLRRLCGLTDKVENELVAVNSALNTIATVLTAMVRDEHANGPREAKEG